MVKSKNMKKILLLLATLTLSIGTFAKVNTNVKTPIVVKTGLEVLRQNGFKQLKGKKIGLVTNPTGVDNNLVSTIDILYKASGVELVALYGPEHGVRGDVHAGDKVDNFTDLSTGLPVYSLYGKTRKPNVSNVRGYRCYCI